MARKRDRAGPPEEEGVEKGTGTEGTPPVAEAPGNSSAATDMQAALADAASARDPLQKLLDEARQKAQDNFSNLQRVAADYDNFKKFAERERSDALLRERSVVLCELIEVMENLERAMDAGKKELPAQSGLMKGLQMTLDGIRVFLECNSVRPIEAAGKSFDPQLHEAVYFVSAPGKPEYSVAEELRRGYTISGRVLRTSKVSVVSRPELPEMGKRSEGPGCDPERKEG
jgi:molecular chaperone GrpE